MRASRSQRVSKRGGHVSEPSSELTWRKGDEAKNNPREEAKVRVPYGTNKLNREGDHTRNQGMG
jgi:hypothetical protein